MVHVYIHVHTRSLMQAYIQIFVDIAYTRVVSVNLTSENWVRAAKILFISPQTSYQGLLDEHSPTFDKIHVAIATVLGHFMRAP